MTHASPGTTAARRVAMVVALIIAGSLSACGIDRETRAQMAEHESILAPLFIQTTPADAANWAGDQYDADKRARGTTLLANAPFGGAEPYLNLYREHLKDPAPGVKVAGARGLGLHGTPEDVPALLPLLKDKETAVRLEVVKSLQRLHNPIAIDPLVERMKTSSESEADIRAEAAAALGQYAQPRVLQELIAALDDDNLVVSRSALRSLRTLTGNEELPGDRKSWFRWAAVTKEPFADQREYVYPVFQRDKRWIDYVPFMPAVPNETPAAPAGMNVANASAAR